MLLIKTKHVMQVKLIISPISALSLLAKRKNLNTTRLVASSKVLHDTIPTQNCDIILTLPSNTNDMTLMWLLARLRTRRPELRIYVRHWKNTGVYALYMTADYDEYVHSLIYRNNI